MEAVFERLRDAGLVPVIQLDDADDAVPLAKALLSGGMDAAEVTYRTDAAEESIRRMRGECPEMLVMAGTVLTVEQARSAAQAGADILVSPGYGEAVVDWCAEHGVAVIPGVSTATEVQACLSKGLSVLKFFPAEASGGVRALDALKGPFPSCLFMPTGGITRQNMGAYAAQKNVIAVSGSWLSPRKSIQAHDWAAIERLCGASLRELQGFGLADISLGAPDGASAQEASRVLDLLGFQEEGGQAAADAKVLSVTESRGGEEGSICIHTNSVERALRYLSRHGIAGVAGSRQAEKTAAGSVLLSVRLDVRIAGFSVMLKRR